MAVAAKDGMAFGETHTLQGRELRIPDDVAVTGFDDIEEAAWFAPPLTSVEPPLAEMGMQAVEGWSELAGSATSPIAIPLRARADDPREPNRHRITGRRPQPGVTGVVGWSDSLTQGGFWPSLARTHRR